MEGQEMAYYLWQLGALVEKGQELLHHFHSQESQKTLIKVSTNF